MIKTIIKETGIVILLLVALVLVLGIIFYDYIPNNKEVPVKVKEYPLSEDIKAELRESISEEGQNIVKTFYIDSSDLDLYESTNEYDKGKANPFVDYTEEEEKDTSNNISINNQNTNNNTNNNISNNTVEEEQEENKNEVYINTPGKNY